MNRILVVTAVLILACGAADRAQAQCYGWPVHCTGINPATGGSLGPSIAASAGVAFGFYSLGEAIGVAIFGDIDKAMPIANAGNQISNSGIAIYANNVANCPRALPRFVLAEAYLAKAHQMVAINISINRNLANVRGWIAACGAPGDTARRGVKIMLEGDAFRDKHECRQALLKWADAKAHFERAAAMGASISVEFSKDDLANVNGRLEKLKNGEYATYGCNGMQTEIQRTTAGLRPATPIDTTALAQPKPGLQSPSQRQTRNQVKRCPAFGEPHVVCGASPGAAFCCPTPSPHCAGDVNSC
jgi:hypothetical protein